MDFKASCGELSNISSQINSENKNITANISKIEKAVEQLKTVWKDASSETYCKSLLDYVKSVSQLTEYYKTIGSYADAASKKYDEADLAAVKKGRQLEAAYMDTLDSADLTDYIQTPYVYEDVMELHGAPASTKGSIEKAAVNNEVFYDFAKSDEKVLQGSPVAYIDEMQPVDKEFAFVDNLKSATNDKFLQGSSVAYIDEAKTADAKLIDVASAVDNMKSSFSSSIKEYKGDGK